MLETHGLLVRQRTQAIKALPSHLSEFGIIAGMSTAKIAGPVEIVRDETDAALAEGGSLRRVGPRRSEALKEQVDKFEREIVVEAKRNEHMRRLARIPGVGAIMAATIRALVPVPGGFKSGRYFAAWLGLTPKSPGSKTEPVPRKCAPSPPATSPVGPRRRPSHAGTQCRFRRTPRLQSPRPRPHPHATRCLFMVRPQLNTHSGHRAGGLVQHVQHVFSSPSRSTPARSLDPPFCRDAKLKTLRIDSDLGINATSSPCAPWGNADKIAMLSVAMSSRSSPMLATPTSPTPYCTCTQRRS